MNLVKPQTAVPQRLSINKSRPSVGFNNLSPNMTKGGFNNTMTNLNKNSTRSITPTNMNKGGASREFLKKNQISSNASFSSGFGMKKGSISKSPSNFSQKITISKAGNDKSFDINVNKSYEKSREFNPKSTFKINSKSPVSSSRTNIKKPNYGNISISTNSSPLYRNSKNNITPNKSPDNHMIKQYNDMKSKNAPSIYSSFIKKKPTNIVSNVKKITPQTANQNNNLSDNSFNNINRNNQNAEKKTINSNMNSIDVSTNNTNGLNSNNNARNNGNSNENDCFQQIQPKYEEENKFKQNNNFKNNNNVQNNNQTKPRENKFTNNNSQNVDFKQMNTSPLLRVFNILFSLIF